MLKHTRKLLNQTINDFNILRAFFSYTTQIIYIIYLTYLLITPNEIWYIHLALLLISIPFLVYDIISNDNINRLKKEKPRFWRIIKKRKYKKALSDAKKSKNIIKKIKSYTSHTLKLIVLAVSFYPIIVSPNSVHPLSIICTSIMAIVWLLHIVVEVLTLIIQKRIEMFKEALSADMEFITKPVSTVKSTFKRIIGKESEEESDPTENRDSSITDWLDARISGFKRKTKTETYSSVENDDNNEIQ